MAFIVGILLVIRGALEQYRELSLIQKYTYIALMVAPIVHIVGGFAVLRAFKKNHPLRKNYSSPQALEEEDSITKEFFEQNEAIAAELLKFDEQLNKWQSLAYRWWLKFVVVLETARVFQYIFNLTLFIKSGFLGILPQFAALTLSLFLSAWSGLEIEIAITMKSLARSKRAILLSNICLIVSIITCIAFASDGDMNLVPTESTFLICLFSFAYCGLIPLVTLIGALSVEKVLEQREKFANISSFDDESYL